MVRQGGPLLAQVTRFLNFSIIFRTPPDSHSVKHIGFPHPFYHPPSKNHLKSNSTPLFKNSHDLRVRGLEQTEDKEISQFSSQFPQAAKSSCLLHKYLMHFPNQSHDATEGLKAKSMFLSQGIGLWAIYISVRLTARQLRAVWPPQPRVLPSCSLSVC